MKIFLLSALGALAIALALAGFWLFRVPSFSSTPDPAGSYAGALEKFAAIERHESTLPLSPEGRSRLLTHGHKTGRVFVLLHGLTNAPEQFVPLAKILFASGANVIIPRARYAGFADRLNDVQGLQSGQDLLDQAAAGLDIAAGLGDRVSLVGLSGSGVSAAWMAQNREGIDSVLIMSPFFSYYGHSTLFIDAMAALLSRAPNIYQWWDSELKDKIPGPPYAYPRFGTRSLAGTIQLARALRQQIGPLKASRLDILITATDVGANNALTKELAAQWEQANPGRVSLREFSAPDGVPHDMVDIHQPDARIDLTYPAILGLLQVESSVAFSRRHSENPVSQGNGDRSPPPTENGSAGPCGPGMPAGPAQ